MLRQHSNWRCVCSTADMYVSCPLSPPSNASSRLARSLLLCTDNVNCLLALVALARLHTSCSPLTLAYPSVCPLQTCMSRCRLSKQQIGLIGCVQVAAAHSTHRVFSCQHVLKHMDAFSLSPSVPKCSVGMMFLN